MLGKVIFEGSFEHIALMQLKHLHHPWFIAVQADLQAALPGVCLRHADSAQGPFLFSSGRFTADGFWLSAQPFAFPRDHLDRRRCLHTLTGIDARNLKAHVRKITGAFRIQLRRQEASAMFDRIRNMRQTSEYSKVDLLFSKLCSPGPPLHIILSWSGTPMHQAAMSALFCGDLCLGRYAGNYFARSLCPCRPDDTQDAESIGVAPTRVCLHCWHYHRNLCLDDEFHVILCCPAFERARTMQAVRIKYSLETRRATWRAAGHFVCRHGVFFDAVLECPCMNASSHATAWSTARRMPKLDEHLRVITTTRFHAASFRRLGSLQAEVRRRRW